jgi:hypothetical protein
MRAAVNGVVHSAVQRGVNNAVIVWAERQLQIKQPGLTWCGPAAIAS